MGKTNFEQRPKYANLSHGRCKFFCHQKKRKVKLDKVREGLRPITLRFRANTRKLILGSIGTPPWPLKCNGNLYYGKESNGFKIHDNACKRGLKIDPKQEFTTLLLTLILFWKVHILVGLTQMFWWKSRIVAIFLLFLILLHVLI